MLGLWSAGSSELCVQEQHKHSQMCVMEFQVTLDLLRDSCTSFIHPMQTYYRLHVCVDHSCPSGGKHLQKVISSVQERTSSSLPCSPVAPSFSRARLRSSAAKCSVLRHAESWLLGNTFTTEIANEWLAVADWLERSERRGLLHLLYHDVIGTEEDILILLPGKFLSVPPVSLNKQFN